MTIYTHVLLAFGSIFKERQSNIMKLMHVFAGSKIKTIDLKIKIKSE